MNRPRIFITEDERLVAISLQWKLNSLGYDVVGIAASGQEAIEKIMETHPDLVLMDIKLKGNLDGIETAEQLRSKLDIPIIYLTAYDDDATLQRAKITEPFGYLLKPYQARDLRTTIEMALYKHAIERELRAKEQWSKATLSSIGEGVITTDIHGKITFMNSVAEQLTQWEQAEAVGYDISNVLNLVNVRSGQTVANPIIRAMAIKRIVSLDKNTTLIAKNGRSVPIDDSGAPIIDDQGQVSGGVLVFRDVTEHRQLEEQLHQSKKLEALGQLAAGVAHHFNNLLTSIIGFVTFAKDTLPENHPAANDLERVLEASDKAATLTHQLLAFTRQEQIQLQITDFNSLVEKVWNNLVASFEQSISGQAILAPDVGLAKLDANQFDQLLTHLIRNACDAMPTGGQLTLETQKVWLQENQCQQVIDIPPGEYVLLIVIDTGFGMTDEVKAHLFEPFFTTKPVGQGTGLGLATCLGIVKQHHGYIFIQSNPAAGTKVKVYFPSQSTAV
ncbi:MAG: response regulator [Anaerolineaceae bacterium]|nr:response regulator [Anaerolineaceae bacterium]MCB9100013.1 response regulator [Anaerolineales bacterium]